MKAKRKTAKSVPRPPEGARLSVRFPFDSGDEVLPLANTCLQNLRETARMFCSDDAALRDIAARRMTYIAHAMAVYEEVVRQRRYAARRAGEYHKSSRKVARKRKLRELGKRVYSKRHERRLKTGK